MSIGGVKSVGKSTVQARTVDSVSGSLRYEGTTFTIASGQFDDVATAITATTSTVLIGGQNIYFNILGVYSASTGFVGSVQEMVGTSVIDTGSVGAVAATTSEVSSGAVVTLTGTDSGTGCSGVWNITQNRNTLSGTWCDVSANGVHSGTFHGSLNGATILISGISDNNPNKPTSGSGTGNLSGSFASGTLKTNRASGLWTGKEITSRSDTSPPATTDPIEYQSAVVYQMFTGLTESTSITGTGIFQNAANTLTATVTPIGGSQNVTVAFTAVNYVDPLYGVTVNGTITEVCSPPPNNQVYSVVGNVTFNWTSATISITSLQLNVTNINWTAGTMTGTIYYNGGITNILFDVQTLLFP